MKKELPFPLFSEKKGRRTNVLVF